MTPPSTSDHASASELADEGSARNDQPLGDPNVSDPIVGKSTDKPIFVTEDSPIDSPAADTSATDTQSAESVPVDSHLPESPPIQPASLEPEPPPICVPSAVELIPAESIEEEVEVVTEHSWPVRLWRAMASAWVSSSAR